MRTSRAPRNTSKIGQAEAMGMLADAMTGGPSRAIERQEAEGQRDLVNSDTLPVGTGYTKPEDVWGPLQRAGVEIVGPVPNDPLFQYVKLPEGWKKQPTDHSMWSHLVDGKGRIRARIFYKAAFYDREAFISVDKDAAAYCD